MGSWDMGEWGGGPDFNLGTKEYLSGGELVVMTSPENHRSEPEGVEETCLAEGAWVELLCGDKPDMEVLTRGLCGHT